MTIEITATKKVELNPNFPMYLKCEGASTFFYFKSEKEGLSATCGYSFNSMQSTRLDSVLEVYSAIGIQETTRQEFAEAMMKCTVAFEAVLAGDMELMETEVNYPLNAVL